MTRVIQYETITERTCNGKMIAGTELRKFPRSWTAHEKEYAGSIPLSFVDTECSCRALAARWNCHYELTWTRHSHEFRRVKTNENYAGCKLGSIEYASFVHGCSRDRLHADWHSRMYPDILP